MPKVKRCYAADNEYKYYFDSRVAAAQWLVDRGLSSANAETTAKNIAKAIKTATQYCGLYWADAAIAELPTGINMDY